jgi:hypothetical protein
MRALLAAAFMLVIAPVCRADAPSNAIQTSGIIDGYYMYQFANPKGGGVLPGDRAFDVRHDTPTLCLVEFSAFRTPQPGGVGWKATVASGDVIDAAHGGVGIGYIDDEPRLKNILQLYGSYETKHGTVLDFGKFVTPYGYEVLEPNGNYNFSGSLPANLVPSYHAGLRATFPTVHGLSIVGYVVNALYNTTTAGVHDDNGRPSALVNATYADPSGKLTLVENLGGGTDKFNLFYGAGVNNRILASNSNLIYNITPASLIGLDYTYVRFDPAVGGGQTRVMANGYGGYYKRQLTAKTSLAMRASGYDEAIAGGVKPIKPWEVTTTYEIKAAANFITRFEYRHDRINKDNGAGILFADGSGAATRAGQDTLTVAGLYSFQ